MAVEIDFDIALGRDRCHRRLDQRLRARLVGDRRGAQVDAQDGKVGNHIVGSAAVDFGGVDAEPRADFLR